MKTQSSYSCHRAAPGLLRTLTSASLRTPLPRTPFPLHLPTAGCALALSRALSLSLWTLEEGVGSGQGAGSAGSPSWLSPPGCVSWASRGGSLGLSFLTRKVEGSVPTAITAFQ